MPSLELRQLLRSGDLPTVFHFSGEAFLRLDALRALQRHCENTGYLVERFAAPERTTGAESFQPALLHSALYAPSLFQDKSLIIVSPADRLISKHEGMIQDFLQAQPTGRILALESAHGTLKTPKKAPLFKIKFAALKNREVPQWVVEQGAEHGLKLASQAASHLAACYSNDLSRIDAELYKLSSVLTADERKQVTRDLVSMYCAPDQDEDFFGLQDALGAHNAAAALRALNRFDHDAGTYMALASIFKMTRQQRQVCELKRGGLSKDEIASELGIHPFVAQKLLDFTRHDSPRSLLGKEKLCIDFDAKIKSGQAEPRLLCEQLLLLLCKS